MLVRYCERWPPFGPARLESCHFSFGLVRSINMARLCCLWLDTIFSVLQPDSYSHQVLASRRRAPGLDMFTGELRAQGNQIFYISLNLAYGFLTL